ncbi:MAG: VOC family protein [Acidimicrobiia bacterium]|nr:VOC family protein [Acidimicrobiia bacterium]
MDSTTSSPIRWRGVNHLALVTPDMDSTVRFYAGVLGMRLVCTTMAGPMRHYFFEIGPQNTVAFFEIPGVERFEKPAGAPPPDFPIQFDHLSFNVPDEDALEALRKRLIDFGSDVTDVVDHGFIRSVYFTDPNGISLEASWWVIDATGRATNFDDRNVFGDPDPVPAVSELMRTGRVDQVPTTKLLGSKIVDMA